MGQQPPSRTRPAFALPKGPLERRCPTPSALPPARQRRLQRGGRAVAGRVLGVSRRGGHEDGDESV